MQINLNHIERNINRNKTRSEINMQKVINSHCHIYPNKIAARAVEGIGDFYDQQSGSRSLSNPLSSYRAKAG